MIEVNVKYAALSPCGMYRYQLVRAWDPAQPFVVFVMLNPSTADASKDDPTIRKCVGFARRLGYGGIVVVNLFAYRATKPADLKAAGYPVGPANDDTITEVLLDGLRGQAVVCAWGTNARAPEVRRRADQVLARMRELGVKPKALRLTEDGIPWHPLMLPYSCQLQEMPACPKNMDELRTELATAAAGEGGL